MEKRKTGDENRGHSCSLSLHFWSTFRSPFFTFYIPFQSSESQESNGSNHVRFGAEMRKIWPSEDNCIKLRDNFAHHCARIIRMDRDWMWLPNRLSRDYVEGFGFSRSYQKWIFHGKEHESQPNEQNDIGVDTEIVDATDADILNEVVDALNDACGHIDNDINIEESTTHGKFDYLLGEANKELYPGCKKFSALTFLVKLMHIKILNRWSDKSFDMLLQVLVDAFPKRSNIPKTYYDAKKMLRDLGLGYDSIHACKYDCALFWKENETLDKCPVCDEPRYKFCNGKGQKIPQKVLRHFPLKSRLQRLFMSRHTTSDMRWHKEKRISEEGVLRHPADSEAWKDMDTQFPWFSQEPRNVRLGLATDGFNPFGSMSPQALGRDIDVHLRPLIEELKELWHEGVQTFDVSTGENFRMHACVLWTINDFPAYGNLAGWSTKGYKACPVCNEDTSSLGIEVKYVTWAIDVFYLLIMDGEGVDNTMPGKHPNNVDRKRKRVPEELNWTKKSIFFELEYWSKLKLRHNIDVMHVEKNVCDSVVGTLLNIVGKTKDTNKARLDLADMNIRKELHLQIQGNKLVKPHACYTLTVEVRKEFCKFLKSVKFPDGYAANLSRNVSINDGKISGLKSHDCHVLLQKLLPIAIRPYFNKDLCTTLVELCSFFQKLCAKTLYVNDLEKLEEGIVLILCKLERIFPPAFFDVMVHLMVHLPREAKLARPVSYRWMYPFERNLGTLKRYVRNKARPEAGSTIRQSTTSPILKEELTKAHWYIMNNCPELRPYLDEHTKELERTSSHNLEKRQEHEFPKWLADREIDFYGVLSNVVVLNYVLGNDEEVCGGSDEEAYQDNESHELNWFVEQDDGFEFQRSDRLNIDPEVVNDNVLILENMNDNDDNFICDDIEEEDETLDDYANENEMWLSSDSESESD
ncbi:hypothetical protein CK203_031234 [Vitis vinifera]|uniref:DUF4218 domain-containing protein n=1 Tax=Vitis vinifera TaxID=29760 RepID=A0A438IXD8_VITVI|nr:hypothetical protein CK203_031234 [Vitis vinifera]